MKIFKNSILLICLLISSQNIFSSEITYKCKSGWFSSINLVEKNGIYFLDGVKYPNYSEAINSAGFLWADVWEVKKNKNELRLLYTVRHAKNTNPNFNEPYKEKVEYFILNLRNLQFKKGVEKYRGTSLVEEIFDWYDGSSGTCVLK
tara:strand:- start:2689 stop:3129 length:441 start_codon:yes stop_codon:yes gene_type:complete